VTSNIWDGDGVSKKIVNQIKIWNNLGVEAHAFILVPPYIQRSALPALDIPKTFIFARPSRLSMLNKTFQLSKFLIFPDLSASLKEFAPNHIYLRYELFKPFMLTIRRFMRTSNISLEINMLDQDERTALASTLGKRLISIYNNLTRGLVFRLARKYICVTNEIANHYSIKKYHRPTHVSFNSIDVKSNSFRKEVHSREIPNILLIVANEQPWHGVDILREIAIRTVGRLNFMLVGNFQTEIKSPNVSYLGRLEKEKLDIVVKNSDIAISSLAFQRSGLQEGCPLKTRDYLAWGLPTILGYEDSIFWRTEKPEWILQVDFQKKTSKSQIEEIIHFCDKMQDYIIPKELVIPLVDSTQIEQSRLDFIRSLNEV
jgi:uncharacterized protein involved in tolerance to divalent cations